MILAVALWLRLLFLLLLLDVSCMELQIMLV